MMCVGACRVDFADTIVLMYAMSVAHRQLD